MFKGITTFSVLALAAIVLLGGCGDSTISKAEFINKAGALCKRANLRRAGEAAGYQRAHLKELVVLPRKQMIEKLIIAVFLPAILKEDGEIEALGAPGEEERNVEALTAGIRNAVKEAEKEPGSVETPTGSGGPFHDVDKMLREYGLRICELT